MSCLRCWSALSVVCALVACGGTERVQIRLASGARLNAQRSVYVLVRAVKEADYWLESYDEVADKVVYPDASVQAMAVALPGLKLSFAPPTPAAKTRLAVYALFEQPRCGAWRVLLPESNRDKVELRLNEDQICVVGEQGQCQASSCVDPRGSGEVEGF